MGPEVVDVVVRCRNEMPFTRATLEALARQERPRARVLFVDCESTDGSREVAEQGGCTILDWPAREYVPGRVLNEGMRRTTSEIVAFVNADAIPLDPGTLAALVAPLAAPRVAACYGRQLPRPAARKQTRLDHARAFGDEELHARVGHFFSMAGSAIRRDAWRELAFDERLRYSEDVDWTFRVKAKGWAVRYVPDARFEHSHDYDLRQQYRRSRGEGVADTHIFGLREPSPVAELLRPLVAAWVRDLRGGACTPRSLLTRAAQAAGYFAGRREPPAPAGQPDRGGAGGGAS